MGVDVSHLVLEAFRDTDDQVVDDGADGSEGGDVLADTMVDVDGDDVLLGRREADGDVGQVLDQLAPGPLDSDLSGLDLDLDCLWRQNIVSIDASTHACCMSALASASRDPSIARNRVQICRITLCSHLVGIQGRGRWPIDGPDAHHDIDYPSSWGLFPGRRGLSFVHLFPGS